MEILLLTSFLSASILLSSVFISSSEAAILSTRVSSPANFFNSVSTISFLELNFDNN